MSKKYGNAEKAKSRKKEFKVECDCRKEIIGFSEHHAKQNLKLHKAISHEHKDRMKLIQEVQRGER